MKFRWQAGKQAIFHAETLVTNIFRCGIITAEIFSKVRKEVRRSFRFLIPQKHFFGPPGAQKCRISGGGRRFLVTKKEGGDGKWQKKTT